MPETIEEYYGRVDAAADDEGRLAMDAEIAAWEIFCFEAEGLRLKPLEPLADSEAPRHGEDPAQCHCSEPVADDEWAVWTDDHWKIGLLEQSGAPLILLLSPRAHYDFTDLPMDRAAEMGQIMVALGAAIEALPSVARVHVSKWGDGGAHAHIFFYARPTRMPQLRGTMMAVWDDFLPRVPGDVRDGNARAVIQDLVGSYGGHALGRAV
jgi:diadenosine tetraphosphate (Ap4A) HIT family hydrolase